MLCCYILVLILLAHDAQGVPAQSTNEMVYFSERLAKIIEEKCLKNADESKYEEALDGLYHFISRWQFTHPGKDGLGEDRYNYCIEKTKNFTNYLNEFVEKLTPCLEPQEHYLKQFIPDSYGDYNHHLCKFISFTGSNKINHDKCYKTFREHPEIDPQKVCYKSSRIFGNTSGPGIITKQKFCDDISQINSCYEEKFDKHCPNAHELRELTLVLLTQGLKNCAEEDLEVDEEESDEEEI